MALWAGDETKPSPGPPAAALVAELRAAVERIEGASVKLAETRASGSPPGRPEKGIYSSSIPIVNAALRPGLVEIHGDETRGMGAATGFTLALAVLRKASPDRPLVWIGTGLGFGEAGQLYAPGLVAAGLDPGALLCVSTSRLADAVWAAEEAARSGLAALTVLEARGNPGILALEGTRRLHLRAGRGGTPFVLLRQGGQAESTAAPLRLRIAAGRSRPPPDLSDTALLVGRPAFALAVEKHRGTPFHRLLIEWNAHERRFELPARKSPAPSRRPSASPAHRPGEAAGSRSVVALGPAL